MDGSAEERSCLTTRNFDEGMMTNEYQNTTQLSELRNYLKNLPAGELKSTAHLEVTRLLSRAWPSLKITAGDANLEPWKLLGRTENLTWNPPLLTFEIERHGATVMGSTRAHVYPWSIDLEQCTATMGWPRMRQVLVKDAPLKVQPIAEEIAACILIGKADSRLKWKSDTNVRVLIGDVIPATNQQTTSGRRRRFRVALEALILSHGWTRKSVNSYERRAT
jgi:hypothetical protein